MYRTNHMQALACLFVYVFVWSACRREVVRVVHVSIVLCVVFFFFNIASTVLLKFFFLKSSLNKVNVSDGVADEGFIVMC